MTVRQVGRALAGLLVALLVVGCSASVSLGGDLDTDKLEDKIRDEFAKTVQGKIEVSCPSGVKVKEGATFECVATADDGSSRRVRVIQTDDEGNVRFEAVDG